MSVAFQVVSIHDECAVLKYMHKKGENIYQWPAPDEQEYSTEPLERIVTSMESPVLLNQRQQFKFLNLGDVSKHMADKKLHFHFM